ncbi:glycosyltransferase [Candidatus Parcubacteria bacterium]|nr:MAG: glycosyltransferase [Candidatus Parcubacteria bacterium]
MKLSIVTTLYHSAPFLDAFYRRATAAASTLTDDFELVFVNDGSPDDSLAIVLNLCEQDEHVRVVDLSRNFGHHKAMMTGLMHARGDLIFLLDCDLEEAPEWLLPFYQQMQDAQADVVYGVQRRRKGGWFERFTGFLFYSIYNAISDQPIPRNLITARLMTRRYVDNLIQHQDREVFIAGLWAITGFKQVPFVVDKASRVGSSYTLARRVSLMINGLSSFSSKPLVFISYLGMVISVAAGLFALYLLIGRLLGVVYLTGWLSLIVSVWLLGGLIIFGQGIIGIYLSKVFMETKRRPYTVVRAIYPPEAPDSVQMSDG